jgi:predicted nucleic acid-binding protein
MRLVVDAGPLIALSKTGHLDLLPALFDEVVVPAAVLDEVAAPGDARPGCEIRDRAWAVVARSAPISERLGLQRAGDIAAGEAEAILLTAEAPDSTVLLVDDRRARRVAETRGLRCELARSWSPPRGGPSCSLRTSGIRSRHFGRNAISMIERQQTSWRCSTVWRTERPQFASIRSA